MRDPSILERTFIHCPGIGASSESRIWRAGIHNWADFLTNEKRHISDRMLNKAAPVLQESAKRLAQEDHEWFAAILPAREHWRAWEAFGEHPAFLDIETTGGMSPDDLTVVGMFDGKNMHQFIKGRNLHEFPAAIADKTILITFFGTGFDLPFLRRAYNIELNHMHIDLCFLLKRLGYSGGLKKIEHELGINRTEQTDGLSGMDAVRLWYEWRRGKTTSLQTLLTYNREDVINMRTLLEFAYPLIVQKTLYGA